MPTQGPMKTVGPRLGVFRRLGVALALSALATVGLAQDADPDRPLELTPEQQAAVEEMAAAIAERARINTAFLELEAAFVAAFRSGELEESERILGEQIALKPSAFTPYYNLACVQAIRGDGAAGIESLTIALERGFDDRRMLETDPNLAGIRDEPMFGRILAAWSGILDRQRDGNLRAASAFYVAGYTDTVVEDLRVVVRSSYDERTTADAVEEMRRVAAWADATLFAPASDSDAPGDTPGDTPSGPPLAAALAPEHTPWVVVILPNDRDFTRWQVREFGPMAARGASTVGGLYDHDRKRLVVRDLGATLRHEMMHVLHWRHMSALSQRHPIWLQEGLGAIVEDMDPPAPGVGDGAGALWTPAPSWRTNTARRMARINGLTPISRLAEMTPAEFSKRRPLAMYAEVRAWMMWLHERGVLAEWYRAVCRGHADDPTGMRALFEATVGADADVRDVMRAFRLWLRAVPAVPERGDELDATLGIDATGGSGDGPVVTRVRIRSALRRGDVVRSIGGRPVRDLQELVRVMGAFPPGDTVEVGVRRGREHLTVTVGLAPAG